MSLFLKNSMFEEFCSYIAMKQLERYKTNKFDQLIESLEVFLAH